MKKILLMVVAATMATMSVSAQNGYDDTKHEVAVSIGAGANSQWIDVLEEMVGLMVGAKLDNEKFTGPISAEYFYHAKNWLGVGGILVFGQSRQDIVFGKQSDGTGTNTYYTVMPAVKFDWLRQKYFGMYSKLGVGATLRHESLDYDDPQKSDHSESAMHVNWQVSLLGIEAGGPRLRGFAELGAGEQGIALIGLRCKF